MTTPIRTVRIPDDLWRRAKDAAQAEQRSVSSLIRALLTAHIERKEKR